MGLVVRGLYKRYGGVVAVQGLGFVVEPGSVVGLVGPNGAGKTTTMKCILGLVRPSGGEVLVDGVPAGEPGARGRLAYVPELPDAPSWMTPRELLEYMGLLEGLGGGVLRERVEQLLSEWGLAGYADRRIGGLSKGTRKRLLIAQALVALEEKRYVLMDEPMSGLDPSWAARLRSLIRELRGRGLGVLVSSHLLRELEGLVDSVVVISRGRTVFQGSLEELGERVGGVVEARVSDPERVAGLLRSSGLVESVAVEGDVVRARLAPGVDAGEVVGLIYSSGVRVLSVEAKRVSLEDVYRELVGAAE